MADAETGPSSPGPSSQDIQDVLARGKGARGSRFRLRAIAVLVIAGLAGWFSYDTWFRAEKTAAVTYATVPVTRGELTVTVTATGTVEPTTKVEISSELSGMIRAVKVDFNDRVEVGQVLAELDTDRLKALVAHSRASLVARKAALQEAEATVREKERALDRTKQLVERHVASQSDLDTAQAAYDRALAARASRVADVGVAEADLQVDETNLTKTCICSPIAGIVLDRNIDPGQYVASSLQAPVLFTLAEDLRQMQLNVDIDEADVGSVREGQRAQFTVEAYQDREFPAQLTELRFAPQTTEGVVTYTAVLSIDNSELLLRPGMTATADIVVRELDDALLVPNAALRYAPPQQRQTETGGGSILRSLMPRPPRGTEIARVEEPKDGRRTVWVLREGKAEPVFIRVGVSDGLSTEVLEGDLSAGDRVITEAVAGR